MDVWMHVSASLGDDRLVPYTEVDFPALQSVHVDINVIHLCQYLTVRRWEWPSWWLTRLPFDARTTHTLTQLLHLKCPLDNCNRFTRI